MSVHQNVLVNLLDTSKAAPATAESSDKGERNLAVNFATEDEETYQAVAALVSDMPEIARLGKEEAHKAAVLRIIESMLPNIDVTLGDVLQAKRNKDARVQIMKAGCFTSEQVEKFRLKGGKYSRNGFALERKRPDIFCQLQRKSCLSGLPISSGRSTLACCREGFKVI